MMCVIQLWIKLILFEFCDWSVKQRIDRPSTQHVEDLPLNMHFIICDEENRHTCNIFTTSPALEDSIARTVLFRASITHNYWYAQVCCCLSLAWNGIHSCLTTDWVQWDENITVSKSNCIWKGWINTVLTILCCRYCVSVRHLARQVVIIIS